MVCLFCIWRQNALSRVRVISRACRAINGWMNDSLTSVFDWPLLTNPYPCFQMLLSPKNLSEIYKCGQKFHPKVSDFFKISHTRNNITWIWYQRLGDRYAMRLYHQILAITTIFRSLAITDTDRIDIIISIVLLNSNMTVVSCKKSPRNSCGLWS